MNNSTRFLFVDLIRGLAVVLMIFFHVAYDLFAFNFVKLDFAQDWFWWGLPRFIVFLFLWAVGVSMALVHQKEIKVKALIKRSLTLLFWALAISISTYIVFPTRWIYFGTLHCILLSSIGILPFLRFPKLALLVGATLLFFSWVLKINIPWIYLPIYSMDYIPLFPWIGVALVGVFSHSQNWHSWQFSPRWEKGLKPLLFLGRHSLAIYIIHQPLIYGLIAAVAYLKRN